MTKDKEFIIDEKELEEMSQKSAKFWEVLKKCSFTTLDEKQKAKKELNIEPTPKSVIYREGSMTLSICHNVSGSKQMKTPLIIIPSLINKNFILDLIPGFSLIEFLTKAGVKVYVMDWGVAGEEHSDQTLDELIDGYIKRAVIRVKRHAKSKSIHVMGQCIGGILSTIFAAKYQKELNIKSHISLTTPIDFENGGKLKEWTNPATFNLDKITNSFKENGAIPPEILHAGFSFLDLNLTFTKYRNLFNFADNDAFVGLYRALDFWGNDNIPFPCEVFRRFIRDFYQENKLIKGELLIGDEYIDLDKLTMPLFNIIASNDHVFPAEAAQTWREEGKNKKDVQKVYQGGHVSIIAALPVRMEVYGDILEFLISVK